MTTGTVYSTTSGRVKATLKSIEDYGLDDGHAILEGVTATEGQVVDITATPPVLIAAQPVAVDLVAEKQAAKYRVDLEAGARRTLVGSQGYGQEMTYVVKTMEAESCLADIAPDRPTYPMMASEIGITAPDTGDDVTDLHAVATVVKTMNLQWRAMGGAIDAVRLATKAAIDAAATVDDIQAITASISWPV
ncbi:MAG: hypothetical protein JKY34_16305 [Kordiimonadaceae bacterium]|nr:hypothetical protein [Kordiimonadaceae bacterium]